MIVWSGNVGSSVTGSGVVRSYGPIDRTHPMALNPLRLKVSYGNQQDIPYFNKIAVYSYEKLNSNIPKYFLTEHLISNSLHINAQIYLISVQLYMNSSFIKTAYKKLHS